MAPLPPVPTKTRRDRVTIELSTADRDLLTRIREPLAKQGLEVNDARLILGVFRRHAGLTHKVKP